MPHKLVMTRQVRDWLHALRSGDPVTRRLVAEAIDLLLDEGPRLGRPLVDRIGGSRLHSLKELRPGSSGASECESVYLRPGAQRRAAGRGRQIRLWQEWYRKAIPAAEAAYEAYLKERR